MSEPRGARETTIELGTVCAERNGERSRLSVLVRAGDVAEPWWFDIPADLHAQATATASPWLVAVLPLAAALGATVTAAAPVDARLVEQLQRILQIWRAWYAWVRPVRFDCPTASPAPLAGPRRAAAFFSGGVDSLFTAIRPRDSTVLGERAHIDELISVHGFDIPLGNVAAFQRLRERHAAFARDRGCSFVHVTTNLRETRLREVSWGWVSHGCAMAAAALVLEPRYHTVLIPATGGYRDLHPWASHPLTDPLFSTSATAFVHDGAGSTRLDKLRLLTQCVHALDVLRVCWESRTDENCGHCNKCLRTLALLECLGALGRASTFPERQLDTAALAHVHCAESWDYREFRDLRALARSVGRPDIARAAAAAMRRSRRAHAWQRARDRLAGAVRSALPRRLTRDRPPTAERPPAS